MTDNRTILTRTKAGRRFMGFMVNLNSGDPQRIQQLIDTAISDPALAATPADQWHEALLHLYNHTNGLRVMQVVAEDEYRVVVLMQAHTDGRGWMLEIAVEEDYPHKITEFIQRLA